jgi:hypothetical protein
MCHRVESPSNPIEIDHIVPLSLGGLDVDSNTRALCRPCHRAVTREQFLCQEYAQRRMVGQFDADNRVVWTEIM